MYQQFYERLTRHAKGFATIDAGKLCVPEMFESLVGAEFRLLGKGGGARVAFVTNPAVNLQSVTSKVRFRFQLFLAKIAGEAKAVVTHGLVTSEDAGA